MKSKEWAQKTIANKSQIWKLWSDVNNWNKWDNDVKSSTLLGEFRVGSKGILKPLNGPQISFIISECTHKKSFTNVCHLPFCRLEFVHELQERGNELFVVHRIIVKGLLSFFFWNVMGKDAAKSIPLAMGNLIKIAESNE